jgi:PAS domain S-box-containing protein
VRLRTQIVLLIALLITSLGVVSATLAVRLTSAALEGELEQRAAILTQALAEPVAYDLINGEVLSVRETLETLVGRIEEIEFAFVTDFNGAIFAHTFEGGFPRALLHHAGPGMDSDWTPKLYRYSTAEGPLLVVERPIVEGMRAHIDIGFSEDRTRGQIERLRFQILGVTLGTVLVGVLLGSAVSGRMTRPLRRLAETMRTFGRRSDTERVEVEGGGREVAKLVEAFRRMIGDLAQAESQRDATLEALRGSEERYRAITDTAEDVIFCTDTDRRYIVVNPAMERLFGRPAAELLGRTPEELFDEESAAIVAEAYARALTGEVVSEMRTLLISGAPHVFHTVQVPLRDAEGTIIGVSGIVRDVTELVRAEEELRQHRDRLEALVDERTGELRRAVNLMAGREVRMAELKEVVRELRGQLVAAGLVPAADDPLAPPRESRSETEG